MILQDAHRGHEESQLTSTSRALTLHHPGLVVLGFVGLVSFTTAVPRIGAGGDIDGLCRRIRSSLGAGLKRWQLVCLHM